MFLPKLTKLHLVLIMIKECNQLIHLKHKDLISKKDEIKCNNIIKQ